MERILLKIGFIPDIPYDTKLLTIDVNGADAASMVSISRLMMNRQVYLHKLRAISDLMTKRMISLSSVNSSFLASEEGYEIYKKFEHYSDYSLIDDIINSHYDPLSAFYAQSIKDRKLFKLIRKINIEEISFTGKNELIGLLKNKKERRTFFEKIENEFGMILGIDPKMIIIDYHESHVKNPSGEIYVKDGSKRLSLSDISPINMEDEDKREKNIFILVPPEKREEGLEKVKQIDF